MFLVQPITAFTVGDLSAATSPAFAGVGDMSNTVFMVGIVTLAHVILANAQQAVHPVFVLLLLLVGIVADVFTFIKVR
jgi:hypothetical protein